MRSTRLPTNNTCIDRHSTVLPTSTPSASASKGATRSNSATITAVSLSSGVTIATGLPVTPSSVSLVTGTVASASSTATTGAGSKVQFGSYAALLAGVVMAI